MSEIAIEQLHVTYTLPKKGSVVAIKNLSLTLEDGSFNVVLGASGCGKTTLLKAAIGLIPYEGVIKLDGVDIYNYPLCERNFAYVSQDIVLQPHITIFDNIAYPLRIRGMEKKQIVEKVNEIAKELDIVDCLPCKPRQISIGQAQRVAIARALIKNASFYFFDEPFSNLDVTNRDNGRHLIQKVIKSHHASALYVTHSIKEATSLADRIFVMDNGELIFSGNAEELYNSTNPKVKALVEASKDE